MFGSNLTHATYECSLDGAAFAVCAQNAAFGDLSEGSHTLSVRAVSLAGVRDATPATASWVQAVETVIVKHKTRLIGGGCSSTSVDPSEGRRKSARHFSARSSSRT